MLLCFVGNEGGFDELSTTESPTLSDAIKYNMRKSLDLEQEGCYLEVGKKECLEECGFNVTAKTIFIIHGWTVIYSSAIYPVRYPPRTPFIGKNTIGKLHPRSQK